MPAKPSLNDFNYLRSPTYRGQKLPVSPPWGYKGSKNHPAPFGGPKKPRTRKSKLGGKPRSEWGGGSSYPS